MATDAFCEFEVGVQPPDDLIKGDVSRVEAIYEAVRQEMIASMDWAPGYKKRWLPLRDAAWRLGVSRHTLGMIAARGEIDVWCPIEGAFPQRYSAAHIDRMLVEGIPVDGVKFHQSDGRLDLAAKLGPIPEQTIGERLDAAIVLLARHGVLDSLEVDRASDRLAYAVIKATTRRERAGKYACLDREFRRRHANYDVQGHDR